METNGGKQKTPIKTSQPSKALDNRRRQNIKEDMLHKCTGFDPGVVVQLLTLF